jgi:hypothetical protein
MAQSLKLMLQAFRVKVTEKLNALNTKIENIKTGELSKDAGNSIVKGTDNLPFYKKQTAAEIKTAYESNTDTNAFTDAHKTNLENLGTDLGNKADLDQIPNFAITDVITANAADNTIELFSANSLNYEFDGGDAIEIVNDQGQLLHYLFSGGDKTEVTNYRPISNLGESNETIKSKYEANPNTNAFTDANKTKVESLPVNVESTEGAQAKATAAEDNAKNFATTGDQGTLVMANNYADSVGATKVDKDGSKVLSDVNFSTAKDAKLAAIEDNATADQTGAEIKSLYEAEANTNAYTDDEKTKLAGVEAGATADQTGAEIKSLYEAEPNTNAFTDAEKAKLAGVEGSRFKGTYLTLPALEAAHPTANAGDYADVDAGPNDDVKRYIWDVSNSKWIPQSGELAGETSESIKTKYEANPDTNAFTDAEKLKLTGVETGATADQTGAEIKSLYEAEPNTNAFTDDDKAKLNALEQGGNVVITKDSIQEAMGYYLNPAIDTWTYNDGDATTFPLSSELVHEVILSVNGQSLISSQYTISPDNKSVTINQTMEHLDAVRFVYLRKFIAWEPEVVAYMGATETSYDDIVVHKTLTGREVWDKLDELIKRAKTEGSWSAINSWHPMFGASATKHAYNLKDTTKFLMSFNGNWIINENGNKADANIATFAVADTNPTAGLTGDNAGWTLAWSNLVNATSYLNGATDTAGVDERFGYLTLSGNLEADVNDSNAYARVGPQVVKGIATTGMWNDRRINYHNGVKTLDDAQTKPALEFATDNPYYGSRFRRSLNRADNPTSSTLTSIMYHKGDEALLPKFHDLVRDWELFLNRI